MSLSGLSESTVEQSDNPKSIASLVYAGGHLNGYRPPTKLDIPQLRVPQLEAPPADDHFRGYQRQLRDFDELGDLSSTPALSSVPSIFTDPKFRLDNPRIFSQVVGTEDALDYTILLEKLSWYIDVVELHLVKQISNASSSFFQVTAQFNEIEANAQKTTASLVAVRGSLEKIAQFAAHEKETLGLVAKLGQVEDLASHLLQLQKFCQCYHECCQAATNSPPEAVPLIAQCRELLVTPHDLTPLVALRNPIDNLDSLDASVARHYQQRLVQALLQDFEHHIASVPEDQTIERIGRILHVPGQQTRHSHNNQWQHVSPEFRSTLEDLLRGAHASSIHMAALNEYKDAVAGEVKALVRQQLPVSANPDRDPGALAVALKGLSGAEFEATVKRLFACLSESFRRISTHSKLLLDLCSHLGFAPPTGDLLEDLVGATDTRLAKILRVRTETLATGTVRDFMKIYSLCGIFMSECESICSIYAPELAAYLAGQTKLFTKAFTQNHVKLLSSNLDLDSWKKEELPSTFQTTTDLVVESGDQDPVQWLKEWRAVIDGVPPQTPSNKRLPQNVFVQDDSYFVSRSAVKLVQILSDVLELICLLPQTTTELAGVYIQLLTLFDTRTRALILGTGAMTSGSSIKRISFRHLSLAYESIRFAAAILHNSSGCVQRHLGDSTAFNAQCGDLADSLRQHQADISKKFVSVMEDKAKSYTRSIAITNWATTQPPANHYMQMLVKDISTVSRILEDTLNKQIALGVVSQIFDVYKPALLEAFTSVRIQDATALANVMQDIAYFRDHVQDIRGANNIGEVLYETMAAFAAPEDGPQRSAQRSESPVRGPRALSPTRPHVADMTVGDATLGDAELEIHSGAVTPLIGADAEPERVDQAEPQAEPEEPRGEPQKEPQEEPESQSDEDKPLVPELKEPELIERGPKEREPKERELPELPKAAKEPKEPEEPKPPQKALDSAPLNAQEPELKQPEAAKEPKEEPREQPKSAPVEPSQPVEQPESTAEHIATLEPKDEQEAEPQNEPQALPQPTTEATPEASEAAPEPAEATPEPASSNKPAPAGQARKKKKKKGKKK